MCSVYHKSRDLSSVFNVLRVIQQALSKLTVVAVTMEFHVHGSHCLTDCPKKC